MSIFGTHCQIMVIDSFHQYSQLVKHSTELPPHTTNSRLVGVTNCMPLCLLFCLIRPPLGIISHRYILTSLLSYQTLLYKNTPEDGQINSPKKTNHKNQCHKHCQKNQQLCEANCSSRKNNPQTRGFMTNAGNHLSIHFHERWQLMLTNTQHWW